MARTGTGTGQGGKSYNDRVLAAKVRTKGLEDIYAILSGKAEVKKWSEYKRQMLLKMAPTLLPRLNEHTGRDGEELFKSVVYLPARDDKDTGMEAE